MSPILTGVIASGISGNLTPAWSPEGGYDALATVTVGTTAVASITFSGIPQNYKHLQIRSIGRTSRTDYILEDANVTMNGDTGANYSWHRMFTNPAVGNGTISNSFGASANYINSTAIFATAGAPSGLFGTSVTDILDYSSTTKFKSVRSITGLDTNGQSLLSVEGFVETMSGTWLNSNPITSLTWTPTTGTNFIQHTTFALYGVK
jgi:hypothetical protein